MILQRFRNLIAIVAILALSQNIFSQERPKLVVGIVVDQMRWDYLYRYHDRYSQGGFLRLLGEGFSCENTMINYLPTYTAVGHASIYTGSVPSINGIAGNSFIEQQTGKMVAAIGDKKYSRITNQSLKSGQISPQNLWTTTITDELKLATNFRSKVVSVSLKDRASVLPAGHLADAAFWFDDSTGNWVSSSFYMAQLPEWVERYNASGVARKYALQEWTTLYPEQSYEQSVPYPNRYEQPYSDKNSIVFPIKFKEIFKKTKSYDLLKSSPWGNTATREFAEMALREYRLGKGTQTDFLAISFSAPDYIGHQYAPNSVKVEDAYLRIDLEIAKLLETLDSSVGKGNYLVFLTADHGGAHNALFLQDHQISAGLWDYEALNDSLNAFLSGIYGKNNLSLSMNNYQVNLNYKAIESEEQKAKILADCVRFFEQQPTTAYAVQSKRVSEASVPQNIKEMIINGYCRERSGEVQIVPKPQYYSHESLMGTTHGVWNPYDTHIPLIFYGWQVPKGKSTKEVYITDIAATIAALLRIQMPSGCIGKPIQFK